LLSNILTDGNLVDAAESGLDWLRSGYSGTGHLRVFLLCSYLEHIGSLERSAKRR
jgi:hypothetical protein